MIAARFGRARWFVAGIGIGMISQALMSSPGQEIHALTSNPEPDLRALAAEIDAIKGKLADQAHAMQDVGDHFANLWFAGQNENWPLAEFYWSETRSHIRWATRIIPVRKDDAGQDVDVKTIAEAFENGTLGHLHDTIVAKDKGAFEQKYRGCLEICYGCHKTADKPYLRLKIPAEPESAIINFDPAADWPQ